LGVRRQGYYEWRKKDEKPREKQTKELKTEINNIFFESDRIYGARKILAKLKTKGIKTSRKRIRKLMREDGLVPVTYRRRINTTDSNHDLAVAPNLLKQQFDTTKKNIAWVSDFTYISTDEGWLYLCSVIDLYSRRVVGWAVSKSIDRHLAISALKAAVFNRSPMKGFIFHSDRGSQYASGDFRSALDEFGGIQSMSAKGNPYDNAPAESFFKSIKVECLSRRRFATREQATSAVAKYLLFYNRERIHQSLGYLSPVQFEQNLAS